MSSSDTKTLEVTCPTCKKQTVWQGNPTRPFCSERCKLIDLGAWANDEYKVPTNEAPSDAEDSDEDSQSH